MHRRAIVHNESPTLAGEQSGVGLRSPQFFLTAGQRAFDAAWMNADAVAAQLAFVSWLPIAITQGGDACHCKHCCPVVGWV